VRTACEIGYVYRLRRLHPRRRVQVEVLTELLRDVRELLQVGWQRVRVRVSGIWIYYVQRDHGYVGMQIYYVKTCLSVRFCEY